MSAGIPVLGSVTLSGATSIQRKERDYIIEHQLPGKEGGLVERVGSASTRWEIKGILKEADADSQYQSLIGLLGTTSNLSIPTFGSGYFLAASGTNVFVESFGGNWMPGYGYPRYDYNLKLVGLGPQPAAVLPFAPFLVQQNGATGQNVASINVAFVSGNVSSGHVIVVNVSLYSPNANRDVALPVTDSLGNTYTNRASAGSALGAPTFVTRILSAPVTIPGACTVSISFANGGPVDCSVEIYETLASSAVPVAVAGNNAIVCVTDQGYTANVAGTFNVGNISAAFISGPNHQILAQNSAPGQNLILDQNQFIVGDASTGYGQAVGHNRGQYFLQLSGCVTYIEACGCDAGFT